MTTVEPVTIKFFTPASTSWTRSSDKGKPDLVYGCKFNTQFLTTIPGFRAIFNKNAKEARKNIIEVEQPFFTTERCRIYIQHLDWRKSGFHGNDPAARCDCYVAAIAAYFLDDDFLNPIFMGGKIEFFMMPFVARDVPFFNNDVDGKFWWNCVQCGDAINFPAFEILAQSWTPESEKTIMQSLDIHVQKINKMVKDKLGKHKLTLNEYTDITKYLSLWGFENGNVVDEVAIKMLVESSHIDNHHSRECTCVGYMYDQLSSLPYEDKMLKIHDNLKMLVDTGVSLEENYITSTYVGYSRKFKLQHVLDDDDVDLYAVLTNTLLSDFVIPHDGDKDEVGNFIISINKGTCVLRLGASENISMQHYREISNDEPIEERNNIYKINFDTQRREYYVFVTLDNFPLYVPDGIVEEVCEQYPIIVSNEPCSPYRRLAKFISRSTAVARHLWIDENKTTICEMMDIPKKSLPKILRLPFEDADPAKQNGKLPAKESTLFKFVDSIAKTFASDVSYDFDDEKLRDLENKMSERVNYVRELMRRATYVWENGRHTLKIDAVDNTKVWKHIRRDYQMDILRGQWRQRYEELVKKR